MRWMFGKLAFLCLPSAVRVSEIEGRITESPLDVKLDGVLHKIIIIWCLDIELSCARSYDGDLHASPIWLVFNEFKQRQITTN